MLPRKHFFSKPGSPTGKASRQVLEAFAIPAILVVVGVGAFILGRLSVNIQDRPLYSQKAGIASASSPVGEKNFVASKSGSKYYAAGCAGASRIKLENEVWFATAASAQAAGYAEAANCNR